MIFSTFVVIYLYFMMVSIYKNVGICFRETCGTKYPLLTNVIISPYRKQHQGWCQQKSMNGSRLTVITHTPRR